MSFNDFLAQQSTTTDAPSSLPSEGAQQLVRRLLRTLWSGVRQVAWGIDAFSRVSHGMEVPPDHGARSRRQGAPSHPRP